MKITFEDKKIIKTHRLFDAPTGKFYEAYFEEGAQQARKELYYKLTPKSWITFGGHICVTDRNLNQTCVVSCDSDFREVVEYQGHMHIDCDMTNDKTSPYTSNGNGAIVRANPNGW